MANYSAGAVTGVEVGSVHGGAFPHVIDGVDLVDNDTLGETNTVGPINESMFDCAAVVSIGETPQEASGNIRDIPLFVRDLP